jgi:hypothetical protein
MADPSPAADAPAEPLPWGSIALALVIVGPVIVGISSFLEWAGRNFPVSYGGFDVPAKFVIDSEANPDGSGLPIGVLVLVIAVVGLIGVFAPVAWSNILVWVSGAAATLLPLLFLYQLNDFMDRFNQAFPPGGFGARNTVGVGAALCGVGGVVTLAGAALGIIAARRD